MLQRSVRALLRVDTLTVPISVVIGEHQDEIASGEMLEDIVHGDSEGAIERWGRLRCTSFWDGHFVLECAGERFFLPRPAPLNWTI